jgi:hypothetical protein
LCAVGRWPRGRIIVTRRRAKPKRKVSKIESLRRHLLRLYEEHRAAEMLPTSARFLFYELVAAGVIPKHPTGARRADQGVIDALTDLRERGAIPWDAIVDETRSLDDFTGYPSVADGVDAYLNAIGLDPWDGKAPLIITESRSLAGVLRALTRDYAAMTAPTNGQVAGFLNNDIAPRLTRGTRVLYLGDYDRAGNDIEVNTRRVLERYRSLRWERLALTADQVNDPQYNLAPSIKTDRRRKDGGEHEAVETEALSQATIVRIVRDRLDALLPEPLEDVLEREEAERERIRERMS